MTLAAPATLSRDEVAAVRDGDERAFTSSVEPYRRQIHVHCYRMLGSYDDAEDATQETFLRAWRGRTTFEGRSSLRTWLYRIATNVSLDHTALRRRRVMPQDIGAPTTEPTAEDVRDAHEIPWLQPYPDSLLEAVAPAGEAPDAQAITRETIELAYLAAIQHLPARQRAVLLLRDVQGWSAAEVAELLSTSVASVNSLLQRARATLRHRLPDRSSEWSAASTVTAAERDILARYVDATVRGDVPAIVALLADDARQTMPPIPFWILGRDNIALIAKQCAEQVFGEWRAVLVDANRQPGAAFYLRRPGEEAFTLQVIAVLTIRNGEVAAVDAFGQSLVGAFRLPETLEA